jgi:hypothetical protein
MATMALRGLKGRAVWQRRRRRGVDSGTHRRLSGSVLMGVIIMEHPAHISSFVIRSRQKDHAFKCMLV